ncbi:hypothetical protein STXM2123_4199 [Streptomyces sp. F-3]|uniref:Uncharacterized protein n=1 Tax=Streptomyces thermogriseus TaxID=75292 RepID=A0ABP4DMQ4_9ACTN|nr:hypothetical protein STXM2123_4199 [Streptomyces sp. F-3]
MPAEADAGVPEDPARPARLPGTLALLREHILKEQDGVLPAAPARLSTGHPSERRAVGGRRDGARPGDLPVRPGARPCDGRPYTYAP